MRKLWVIWSVTSLALFSLFASLPSARAEKRVALVIGNGKYENANPLKNPANDAADIAEALEKVGFKVIVGTDTSYEEMRKLVQQFSKDVASADVATFYYAGHGMQVGGENYLVPVNAKLDDKNDLDFQTVSLRLIQRQMEQSAATRLIFLDACRDNPLTRSWSSTSRSTAGRGLASPVGSTKGTYIAFATEPGNVALDGEGARNSPFTTALLTHIHSPGVELASLMKRVRRDVTIATKDKQIPWSNSGLIGDFFFNTEEIPQPNQSFQTFKQEQAEWQAIKDGKDPQVIENFLTDFPNGVLSTIARDRMKFLRERSQSALLNPDDSNKISRNQRPINDCDRLAADNGDNDAIFYRVGQSGPLKDNLRLAAVACENAIVKNPDNLTLQYQLGLVLMNSGDKTKAYKYFKSAADKGYPAAQTALGAMLNRGYDVPKDVVLGVKLLETASLKRDVTASWLLAMKYSLLYEEDKDEGKATLYWKKSFEDTLHRLKETNRPSDLARIGMQYKQGWGVAEDIKKSKEYTKLAEKIYLDEADKGNLNAMFKLVIMYSSYKEEQPIKARDMLQRAIEAGSQDAKEQLNNLKKKHPKL